MFSPPDILPQGVTESTSLLNQADDQEKCAEFYLPEEGIFVPKYMIRLHSREPGHGREQSRGPGAPAHPGLQVVRPAPCARRNRMAGLTQAAVLLKGLSTE